MTVIDLNQVKEYLVIAGLVLGLPATVWGILRSRSESTLNLSKAEAEFRRDLMARLAAAELAAKDAQTQAATASADANRCRADYQELLRAVEQCSTPGCAIRAARLAVLSKGGTT